MSALHLTARRQTGRTHVCTGITEVSRQQVYHPFSPSLSLASFHSFLLSHSTLNHSTCLSAVLLSSSFPNSPSFASSRYHLQLITIYFPYNLSVCFFFHSFFHLSSKKRIKILSSQHRNVMKNAFIAFYAQICSFLTDFFFYIGLYRFYTEQNYHLL